jgi:hypothetical protein
MQFTKKYYLVDPAVVHKLQQTVAECENNQGVGVANVAAVGAPTPAVAADNEMTQILSMKNIPTREKWQKYSAALQRYLHFTDAPHPTQDPATSSLIDPSALDITTDATPMPYDDPLRGVLLAALPVTARDRGLALYNRLEESKTIVWDEKGCVSINNVKIKNSSIVDLIADSVRNRFNSNPTGWPIFVETLAAMNIPRELISNTRRKHLISEHQRRERRNNLKAAREKNISPIVARQSPASARSAVKRRNTNKSATSTPIKRTVAANDALWQQMNFAN